MRTLPTHIGLIVVLIGIGLAVAVPPGGAPLVLAAEKGKQATDKTPEQPADKAKQEGVPAQCARLIKASERRRCLQKAG